MTANRRALSFAIGSMLVWTCVGACADTEAQIPIPFGEERMLAICDGVYAEPGLTAADHLELRRANDAARRNLAIAFGQLRGPWPLTLFCRSASCKVAFGASPDVASSNDVGFARDGVRTADGFSSRPVVVVTGPVAGTALILTHELVHAEMKAWVPYDALPTWFNEGVATMVANEPNCDAYPPSSSFDVTQLSTKQKWQAHIRAPDATRETYCRARHEVGLWAEQFGDARGIAEALRRLMSTIASGGSFEHAYVR